MVTEELATARQLENLALSGADVIRQSNDERRREWLEIVEATAGMFTDMYDQSDLARLREDWAE